MHATLDELRGALTLAEPLGPIAHERLADDLIDDLVYHKVALFSEVATKSHMLLLGRKGAGKSASLAEIKKSADKHRSRQPAYQDDEPIKGRDYIINVESWRQFHQIVRNVKGKCADDDAIDGIIPHEYFVDLWHQILWDEIFQFFYKYHAFDDECRRVLQPVDNYVNVDGCFEGCAQRRALEVFNAAKKSVIEFLNGRKSRLYFLFDSMENYPVRNETFSKIIGGLFQGLTRLNDESSRIIVSFCIPEEIESFFTNRSSNLMKDLSSAYRIRWKPVDLLRIVAHRLRVSASIYDPELHALLAELDFSEREQLHKAFAYVMPSQFENNQGTQEDPLAYIIRHTQLLPRHILVIFNCALSEHYKSAHTFKAMSKESILKGVTTAQKIIAKQILMPYEQLYPKLLGKCKAILPDLSPICNYNTLRRLEGRFQRQIEDDVISVWSSLFEIGVLGRSTNPSGSACPSLAKDDRYCYGQFHFNIDGEFGFATDGEFCFHPVFSRYFGMVRRNGDKRVVYPAHIDLWKMYD